MKRMENLKFIVKYYEGGVIYYDRLNRKHREDGPAVEWNGMEKWYNHGKLHREDGPAYISEDGESWLINGKKHREDGPAIELSSGDESWWKNGQRHREDGPAVITDSGEKWFIKGKKLSKEEFLNNVLCGIFESKMIVYSTVDKMSTEELKILAEYVIEKI